jgi:hypothetical protein
LRRKAIAVCLKVKFLNHNGRREGTKTITECQ